MNEITIEEFLENQKAVAKKVEDSAIRNVKVALGNGIHTVINFKLNKKTYFYKYNASDCDFNDFGEVISSFIYNYVGLNCVNSYFCNDPLCRETDFHIGTLMDNFKEKNKEYISLSEILTYFNIPVFNDNSVLEYIEIIKQFAKEKNLTLDKNLESDLKILAMLDYLLVQDDRHTSNIEFEIYKNLDNKKVIKLAPIFDNESCLLLDLNSSFINQIKYNDVFSNPYSRVKTLLNPIFRFDYNNNVEVMAKEILKDKTLQKAYMKFCEIDVDSVIDSLSDICFDLTGRRLNIDRKNVMKYCIKSRKDELMGELEWLELQKTIKEEVVE